MTAQAHPNLNPLDPPVPSPSSIANPTSLDPAATREPRNLQIENSLPGKLLRRWNFLTRYLHARTRLPTLQRLLPILERHFEHEWLAGARLNLRFLPGNEERELRIPWPSRPAEKLLLRLRYMPWRHEYCPANWSAPVTVTLWKKGKDGGNPVTVRYMSLFLHNNILHIAQLQGVPLIEMPKGLRDWPERFLKAAMEFAATENLREVWVARAQSLYSYHHPWTHARLTPELRDRELKRIRTNIELHHNQTAATLGFQPDHHWFKWQTPIPTPR